jgi:hypothetical protein
VGFQAGIRSGETEVDSVRMSDCDYSCASWPNPGAGSAVGVCRFSCRAKAVMIGRAQT